MIFVCVMVMCFEDVGKIDIVFVMVKGEFGIIVFVMVWLFVVFNVEC